MIYKTLHRKLKIDQHEFDYNRKDKQFLLLVQYPSSCYSCHKSRDKSVMGKEPDCEYDIWNIYPVTVNLVMVATVKRSKLLQTYLKSKTTCQAIQKNCLTERNATTYSASPLKTLYLFNMFTSRINFQVFSYLVTFAIFDEN